MKISQMAQSLDVTPQEYGGWFTFERRNWIMLAFLMGCGGFALGNGHTTQGAISHVADQYGQAKVTVKAVTAQKNCEHRRGDIAVKVANEALASNFTTAVPIPDTDTIPADCPPVPKK